MAGLSFGEAIAMGITEGIGKGTQQAIQWKREDRLRDEEIKRQDAVFEKQRKAQMEDWRVMQKEQEATRARETAAAQKFQTGERVASQGFQLQQEQVRQRFEIGRIAAAAQEAKRTAIFNQNLQYIGQNIDKMDAFTKYGKMDVGQIAQDLALQTAKGAPAKLQQQVFQDTMSRFKGMTKMELLSQANLVPADMSQFVNNPEYKDAIPKGYLAGIKTDGFGMDQVFQYTPPAPAADKEAPASIQLMNKRYEGYAEIAKASPILVQKGIQVTGLDPAVANQIDTLLGQGDKTPTFVDQTTGREVNRVDDFLIKGFQNKTLVYDQATGMITTPKAAEARSVFLAAQEEASTPTPPAMLARPGIETARSAPAPAAAPSSQFVDPSKALAGVQTGQEQLAEQIQYRKDSKEYKDLEKDTESLSDNIGKTGVLKMTESASRARESITSAPPEVKAEMFKAFRQSDGDVAGAVNAIAKSTNPAAKEALMILQDLQATQNARIFTLGGKAVSAQEADRFKREMGQAGMMGSEAELMRGLNNILKMGQDEVAANLEGKRPELQKMFFERSPLYQEMMKEHSVYGTEEGKAAAATRQQAKAEAQALLDQGVDPSEVSQYLEEVYKIRL